MIRLQRISPWLVLVLGAIMMLAGTRSPKSAHPEFDLDAFKDLPVLDGGRIKPLDTVARSALLVIRGKQTWTDADGNRHPAAEWLAQAILAPESAVQVPLFRIDHPDVTGMLGAHNEERKYFSLAEIMPHWAKVSEVARQANPEAKLRTDYENAMVKLSNALTLYNGLTISAQPPPFLGQTPLDEYRSLQALVAQSRDPQTDEQQQMAPQAIELMRGRYAQLAQEAQIAVVPPTQAGDPIPANWRNSGQSLQRTLDSGTVDPVLAGYAQLGQAFRAQDWMEANRRLATLHADIGARYPALDKVPAEVTFNQTQPFVIAMTGYLLVFLAVCVSFLVWPRELQRGAFWLLLLTLLIHTLGLAARMYLQGRPPVTNLYSSAVFIGWGSVLLSVVLERISRIGVASLAAAAIGFTTLVIAQNLGGGGDTMELMRAVLDSNFWLTTHVITVTIGYSATFLAGLLAIAYIVGCFGGMGADKGRIIERMTYGIVCFALLFSFVGTVLGGIWADQSWGRFWGWDPKENGALIIVLWNALVLHARWGRLVRPAGFMQLVVFGNIVTAWSWFGTNLLGVGLHAYGFTDSGAIALGLFILSQVLVIAAGWVAKEPARAG